MPLDPDLLLKAYAIGVFPMADARDDPDIFWVEPQMRAIIPLGEFHLSRSLAKSLRRGTFDIRCNTAFPRVIAACAETASDRDETWINGEIECAYTALHRTGNAHSFECWQDGELVGGLYGVSLGRAFCGESMFSRKDNASKTALAALVAAMRYGGYRLLDCQFMTGHLARMGAQEITQKNYLRLLTQALYGVDVAQDARDQVSGDLGAGALAVGAALGAGAALGEGALGAGALGNATAGALGEGGVLAPALPLPAAFAGLVAGASAVSPSPDDGESEDAAAALDAGAEDPDFWGGEPSSPGKRISHFLTHTS